jgi:hypothetical protein
MVLLKIQAADLLMAAGMKLYKDLLFKSGKVHNGTGLFQVGQKINVDPF